jgi:hypothetical protein
MRLTFVSLVLAAALGGCVASAGVGVNGGVAVAQPDLVEVSPGVQVVADYNDSVFYSDGYYWRNDGGNWYRSTYYSGGWGFYASPPYAVVQIRDPYVYRNYRPTGYVVRHQPYRQQEVIRDRRAPVAGYREGGVRVEGRSDVRVEGRTDAHVEGRTDAHVEGRSDAHVEGRSDAHVEGRTDAHVEGRTEAPHVEGRTEPAPAPVVRDHRTPAPAPAKKPVVRDHR